ncbi:MAG: ABC transporter ATP-binding protein [Bacillota bacterium]|nr:ABC transporter ATP-binding protein [Bacillota bacterium]
MSQLYLENVNYSYRTKHQTVHAVRNVNLCLDRGKMYALVGKSGCGKTTLLSLIAGLEKPDSGRILVGERDLSEIDLDEYRRTVVSVIYQSYNLFPLLNIIENVMFPLLLNGMTKPEATEKAKEMLQKVDLNEMYHRRLPHMLSGGEQQRVSIARALGTGAELILADEPTGNLDAENSRQVVEILKKMVSDEGRTVLVVTHDMSVADVADRVFTMSSGQIVSELPSL